MSLPPDQMPPAKPKISAEERRAQQARRLKAIRLRVMIGRALDDRGITTAAGIGEALGMPPVEATALLKRKQLCEGDVVLLAAAAAQIGLQMPDQWRPGEDDIDAVALDPRPL
jgi:hypothetical protein